MHQNEVKADARAPLYIHALGHFHPENVIDNDFLESLDIGTSNEWILERKAAQSSASRSRRRSSASAR
jgi:3-oxoacyl-[acyl-carrier-protein] synthase III